MATFYLPCVLGIFLDRTCLSSRAAILDLLRLRLRVFLGIYSVLIFAPSPQMRRAALKEWQFWVSSYTPFNNGFIGVYIYVAAFLPFAVKSSAYVLPLLLATCGGMFVLGYFLHLNVWTWGTLTFIALAARRHQHRPCAATPRGTRTRHGTRRDRTARQAGGKGAHCPRPA